MLRIAGQPADAHIETVELEADDLERGFGERFLAPCGVSAEQAAVVLDDARAAAASAGGAVIEVTIDDYGASASVSPADAIASAASA